MRSFGILPAAGLSRRMRRPKLLMPFGDRTLIECVLETWLQCVDHLAIVVRSSDESLAEMCRRYKIELVQPAEDPPDMTTSIRLGLAHFRTQHAPAGEDCWLLAPADMPQLRVETINVLLAAYEANPQNAYVASHQSQGGHPLLASWARAGEVEDLQEGQTMRDARAEWSIVNVECGPEVLLDVDTLEQYERLRDKFSSD